MPIKHYTPFKKKKRRFTLKVPQKKYILCSSIGILIIVKMFILPKEIYGFNTVSVKMPMAFFAEVEKYILKFIRNLKGSQIAKTVSFVCFWPHLEACGILVP